MFKKSFVFYWFNKYVSVSFIVIVTINWWSNNTEEDTSRVLGLVICVVIKFGWRIKGFVLCFLWIFITWDTVIVFVHHVCWVGEVNSGSGIKTWNDLKFKSKYLNHRFTLWRNKMRLKVSAKTVIITRKLRVQL